ncbi:DMT family transporter [Fusobacteria bacterium ZRK30]|nr:DMT family transporter [Fusobacteria bacterium ZRK30]
MYYLMAFLIGGIIIFQMMINSILSCRLGKLNGIFYNFFTGSLLMGIFYIFNITDFKEGAEKIFDGDLWMFGGGILGILILSMCNYAIPRMTVVYATLFIMVGQLVTGNIMEYIMTGDLSMKKILGCTFILTGVMYDIGMEKIKKSKALI